VGWLGPDPDPALPEAAWGSFREARGLIEKRHELRTVRAIELGTGLPRELDLLMVVRPKALHPRAVFEIDQYVQRGGRLLIAVDQAEVSPVTQDVRPLYETGLDALLDLWGARVTPQHVWDERCAPVTLTQTLEVDGKLRRQPMQIDYPLFPRLDGTSFDSTLPPVAGLQQGTLFWAQPIEPVPPERALEGVERVELIRSSEHAWRVDVPARLDFDEERMRSMQRNLYARGSGQAFALAVALSGRLPSPFESGAPLPLDPLAPLAPAAPPNRRGASTHATTDESVLSAAHATQVVVIGDADWMRDGFLGSNETLLANLVDWLVLDGDLLALRARTPRDRPIRSFLAQELRNRGLEALPGDETLEQLDLRMRAEASEWAAARRREWSVMLSPVGASLALVFGLGWFWNLRGRRFRRRSKP
jgi:ABC-type uncharacterized transport system involved in gliding motility auxiliary subunit